MGAKNRHKDRRRPSSEQADLWEHASLLYQNFDWQGAANVFNHMARHAQDTVTQARCFINEGMIYARLGDFAIARGLFERAANADRDEILPYFLLGHVEVELGHLQAALAAFEFCWEYLQRGMLDHKSRGLHFELTAEICQQNAERTWQALKTQRQQNVVPVLMLHGIPAELLFETPKRASQTASPRSSGPRKSSVPIDAVLRTATSKVWSWIQSLDDAKSAHTSRAASDAVASLSHFLTEDEHVGDLPPLPPIKKRTVLIPRDAQVQKESLRELASFIRFAGPGGNKDFTIDKEYMMGLLGANSADVTGEALRGFETPDVIVPRPLKADATRGIDSVLEYYADAPESDDSGSGTVNPRGAAVDLDRAIEAQIAELSTAFTAFDGGHKTSYRNFASLETMTERELVPALLSLKTKTAGGTPDAAVNPDTTRSSTEGRPPSPSNDSDDRYSPPSGLKSETPSTLSTVEIFKYGLKAGEELIKPRRQQR